MKTKKQVRLEIIRRRKLFEKATPAQKRVLIAKDVLEQVRNLIVIPRTGVWIDDDMICELRNEEGPLQEQFIRNQSSCECCAVGAMMMSCTMFNNKATKEHLNEFEDLSFHFNKGRKFTNGLDKFFSRKQLSMIEGAFEESRFHLNTTESLSWRDYYKVADFVDKFKTPKERLIAIMENIIKNKGQFKP